MTTADDVEVESGFDVAVVEVEAAACPTAFAHFADVGFVACGATVGRGAKAKPLLDGAVSLGKAKNDTVGWDNAAPNADVPFGGALKAFDIPGSPSRADGEEAADASVREGADIEDEVADGVNMGCEGKGFAFCLPSSRGVKWKAGATGFVVLGSGAGTCGVRAVCGDWTFGAGRGVAGASLCVDVDVDADADADFGAGSGSGSGQTTFSPSCTSPSGGVAADKIAFLFPAAFRPVTTARSSSSLLRARSRSSSSSAHSSATAAKSVYMPARAWTAGSLGTGDGERLSGARGLPGFADVVNAVRKKADITRVVRPLSLRERVHWL